MPRIQSLDVFHSSSLYYRHTLITFHKRIGALLLSYYYFNNSEVDTERFVPYSVAENVSKMTKGFDRTLDPKRWMYDSWATQWNARHCWSQHLNLRLRWSLQDILKSISWRLDGTILKGVPPGIPQDVKMSRHRLPESEALNALYALPCWNRSNCMCLTSSSSRSIEYLSKVSLSLRRIRHDKTFFVD